MIVLCRRYTCLVMGELLTKQWNTFWSQLCADTCVCVCVCVCVFEWINERKSAVGGSALQQDLGRPWLFHARSVVEQ